MNLKSRLRVVTLIAIGISAQKIAAMNNLMSPEELETKFQQAIESGHAAYVRAIIANNNDNNVELRARLNSDTEYANLCLMLAIKSAENILKNIMPLFSYDHKKLTSKEEAEKTRWVKAYHACLMTALVLIEFGADQSCLSPAYQDILRDMEIKPENNVTKKKKKTPTPRVMEKRQAPANIKPNYAADPIEQEAPTDAKQKTYSVTCVIS